MQQPTPTTITGTPKGGSRGCESLQSCFVQEKKRKEKKREEERIWVWVNNGAVRNGSSIYSTRRQVQPIQKMRVIVDSNTTE